MTEEPIPDLAGPLIQMVGRGKAGRRYEMVRVPASVSTLADARQLIAALLSWDQIGRPEDLLDQILLAAMAKPINLIGAVNKEATWDALAKAKVNALEKLGPTWYATPGATCLIRLPFASFECTVNGRKATIKCRRDWRAPVAEYWPNGIIPSSIDVEPAYPVETREWQWGPGRRFRDYAAWQARWIAVHIPSRTRLLTWDGEKKPRRRKPKQSLETAA